MRSLLLPLKWGAPLFIHKRSVTHFCVPTIQPVPAQQGPLLLHIILLIIPEGNLLLIYNKFYFLRINPRKTKRRKLINGVRMLGCFWLSPHCLSSKSVPFRALALFLMSASCQTLLELAMSCASPVPSHNHSATPSYLYRPNSNNWFHELLLHVSLGMKVPDHRLKLLSDVRKPTKTKEREREEEERKVKGDAEHRSFRMKSFAAPDSSLFTD